MSSLPTLPSARALPSSARRLPLVGGIVALGGAVAVGAAVAHQPMLALLMCALAAVVLAVPFVDNLCVLTFWLLPYLILNLPTGGVTLKVPEVTAYLFATAALARALLRREPISAPPATPQVLLYLAVLAISAALEPVVPDLYGYIYNGAQGPELRSGMMIFWLALSWLVVVSLYHIVGSSPDLYRRCVRAHVLGGGLASLIGIIGYVLALQGNALALAGVGHAHSFVYTGGSFYRLTGVSYEPLLFAFYVITVFPISLAVAAFRPDWVPRWLALTATFVQGVALLLTFSAGGWAALSAGLLLLLLLFRPRLPSVKRAVPALLAVSMLLTLFCANPVVSRTTMNALGKLASGGYKERNDENLTGLRMFEDHFWLGVGPGMTPFYFPKYHPVARTFDQVTSIYVNNLYITTLGETGVAGFAALTVCAFAGLFALGCVIYRHGASRVPIVTAAAVSLIGCAIQYWETQNLFLIYFSVLIGLALAGTRLARREAELP